MTTQTPTMHRINLTLDDRLYDGLRRLTVAQRSNIRAILRQLIEQAMREETSSRR